jgi:hypothetical protein
VVASTWGSTGALTVHARGDLGISVIICESAACQHVLSIASCTSSIASQFTLYYYLATYFLQLGGRELDYVFQIAILTTFQLAAVNRRIPASRHGRTEEKPLGFRS